MHIIIYIIFMFIKYNAKKLELLAQLIRTETVVEDNLDMITEGNVC